MPKKALTFEESLVRIEEIVRALESGDTKLDELLKLYEEGVGLIRSCNTQLEKAELTVKKLQVAPNGEVEAVAWNMEEA